MLLTRFLALVTLWRPVFQQERSFQRAVRPAVGALLVVGSATLTRILASLGRDQQDGSAEYKLHARTHWNEQEWFDALLPAALAYCPGSFVPLALDDTRLRKTGKRIPTVFWQRDPLSPPFHVNLQGGGCVFCRPACACRCTENTTSMPVPFRCVSSRLRA